MNQPTDTPIFPPGHPDAPPTPVQSPPPGMAWGIAPSGERVLAYLPPDTDRPQENAPPQIERRDPWPARLLAGGGGAGAVIAAIGYAGPGLGQAGHAVEMAGTGVGLTCAGIGGLVLLVKGSIGRQTGQRVEVNVNVTNSVTAKSSARSGRRR